MKLASLKQPFLIVVRSTHSKFVYDCLYKIQVFRFDLPSREIRAADNMSYFKGVKRGLREPENEFTLRPVPPNTNVFLLSYDYTGKAALSKGHWNSKRKWWVTAYFQR